MRKRRGSCCSQMHLPNNWQLALQLHFSTWKPPESSPTSQSDACGIFDKLDIIHSPFHLALSPCRHCLSILSHASKKMASTLRPASRLATRPLSSTLAIRQAQPQPSHLLRATSQFHTSAHRNATPMGAPPKGFRLPKPKRFDEGEKFLDQASNYFLMTEMLRGMYVVLEQFFRPP